MKVLQQSLNGYTIICFEIQSTEQKVVDYITKSLNDLGQTANHKAIVGPANIINHYEYDEVLGTSFVVLTNQGDFTIESHLTDIMEYLQ